MNKAVKTQANIILDSIVDDNRITAFVVTFPRIVNAELLRHRAFSFCSASSRAIPITRMIKQYCNYTPVRFSKHKPGMQPGEPVFTGFWYLACRMLWETGRYFAIIQALIMNLLGIAKEQVNRVLEPYSYITLVLQGSEYAYNNFFELRTDENAQFEIKELADLMKREYSSSIPEKRNIHLPFVTGIDNSVDVLKKASVELGAGEDLDSALDKIMIKISCARAARVSYFDHNGKKSEVINDIKLYDRLVKANPPHLSPTEFPVLSKTKAQKLFNCDLNKDLSGNLHNNVWQYRKIIENVDT